MTVLQVVASNSTLHHLGTPPTPLSRALEDPLKTSQSEYQKQGQ